MTRSLLAPGVTLLLLAGGCTREAKATDMCLFPDTLGVARIPGAVDAQGNPAGVRTIIRARLPCDSIPAELRNQYRVKGP